MVTGTAACLDSLIWSKSRQDYRISGLDEHLRFLEPLIDQNWEDVASSQGGYIGLRGENHWAEVSLDFKTLLQVEPTGILTDTFTRKRSGEWVQGHYQEFTAKE